MRRRRLGTVVTTVALTALVLAVPAGASGRSGSATDLGSYDWTELTADGGWAGRAGLQAAQLGRDLFVMGGRGAFDPFGGTPLYDDVWRSSDGGRSWTPVAAAAWPARGYFQAVTKAGSIFVLGGQNFDTVPNPIYPSGCSALPPGVPCFPFLPASEFFDDVWRSDDGTTWTPVTGDAPWEGRAGLSAVVHRGRIFIFGGSQGDDISTGGQGRRFFNDVWSSADGATWRLETAAAGWSPRAGAAAVVKDGWIYLLGGEVGFTCGGVPGCVPPYFNDVWRSRDGVRWEQVTPAAGWSPRPGHQCAVVINTIVCFGGYGEPANPSDVWASRDGATWTQVGDAPWDAVSPDDVKYDFDVLSVAGLSGGGRPAILTFGGDRERFELPPPVNATRVDADVWRFAPP